MRAGRPVLWHVVHHGIAADRRCVRMQICGDACVDGCRKAVYACAWALNECAGVHCLRCVRCVHCVRCVRVYVHAF